jgi:hypothetical protein
MAAFLEIILIFIVASFVLRFFAKLMLPWLLRYTAKRMMLRMGMKPEEQPKQKPGKVSVDSAPQQKTKTRNLDGVGDYTDFEEIK